MEVIDKLAGQVPAEDTEFLVYKCRTLMASDIHDIKLFTNDYIKKVLKCSHPSFLKNYLLPFNTWFDNTVLRELAMAYEKFNILELFCNFIKTIDDTQLITSYPIPTFSQLIIALDDSDYTIVTIKTFRNCNELVLKDVIDVKEFLKLHWELTAHAIQLAAIDYHNNCMHWMIPKQVKSLIEKKLNKGQHKLWNEGIFIATFLPSNFFSADNNFSQQMISNPSIPNFELNDLRKVCAFVC